MATDPLDGDVKRLRFSGSRGSNGDPIGYRPLRSEGGDAMNEALVAAQQLRQDSRAAAEREGQVIVREAEAAAKRLLDEARSAQNAVQVKMAETERQFQQYMGGFRALLERQLAELRALDGGSKKA